MKSSSSVETSQSSSATNMDAKNSFSISNMECCSYTCRPGWLPGRIPASEVFEKKKKENNYVFSVLFSKISYLLHLFCVQAATGYILFHFPLSENIARDTPNKGSKQVGFWGKGKSYSDKNTRLIYS